MFSENNKQTIRREAEAIISLQGTQMSQNLDNLSLDETQKIVYELEVHQIELELQNEELLRTQAELEKTKEYYYDLYDMAPVGYCTLNKDGLIEKVNLEVSNLFAQGKNTLLKQPFSNFIFSKDQDIYYLYYKKVLASQEKEECELRVLKEDKSICWVHLNAIQKGDTIRLIITDISERVKLRKELKEQEKVMLIQSKQAAMGEMISMIAHQWKQPLNVISLSMANLKMLLDLKKEITHKRILDHEHSVVKQINYLSKTLDDFRNFFKPSQEKMQISVEEVLNSALSIIGPTLSSNNIEVNINNTVKNSLLINQASLVQVLLNIIGNSKDAFMEKKVEKAIININAHENNENMTISICDNAGGISESIMNKLAEPYFSTKESQNGTGLGLYIARTILDKHLCGTLSWHNIDEGACFSVRLKKT